MQTRSLIDMETSEKTSAADPLSFSSSEDFSTPESLMLLAESLANGKTLGVLTTVDTNHHPRARWMAAVSLSEFPRLLALTSPHSAKVSHIKYHPQVEWMFSSSDYRVVVNLTGRAVLLDDIHDLKNAWQKVTEKDRAPFLHAYIEKPGFGAIQTTVSKVKASFPTENRWLSIDVASTSDGNFALGQVMSGTLHSPTDR